MYIIYSIWYVCIVSLSASQWVQVAKSLTCLDLYGIMELSSMETLRFCEIWGYIKIQPPWPLLSMDLIRKPAVGLSDDFLASIYLQMRHLRHTYTHTHTFDPIEWNRPRNKQQQKQSDQHATLGEKKNRVKASSLPKEPLWCWAKIP